MRRNADLVDANEEGAIMGNHVPNIWVLHVIGGKNPSSSLNFAAQSTIQGHVTAKVNKYPNSNESSLRTQFPYNGRLDYPEFMFSITLQ